MHGKANIDAKIGLLRHARTQGGGVAGPKDTDIASMNGWPGIGRRLAGQPTPPTDCGPVAPIWTIAACICSANGMPEKISGGSNLP